jgi:hypothetical protein
LGLKLKYSKKSQVVVLLSCTAALIAVCVSSNISQEEYVKEKTRIAQLKREPIITTVSSTKGCEVKYFNRGTKENSFSTSQCGNIVTMTSSDGTMTKYDVSVEPEDEMNNRKKHTI